MASVTATAKAEIEDGRPRRRFRFGGSRLGGFILALNLLSLLILFGGALALNEWQRGLIEARQESLSVQAKLLANVLGELGITQGEPYPMLDPGAAGLWLRDNFIPEGQRARLYDQDGLLVSDSFAVTDAIPGQVASDVRLKRLDVLHHKTGAIDARHSVVEVAGPRTLVDESATAQAP